MTGFFSFRSVPRFQRDRSQAGRRLHHAVHELQRRVRRVRHVHVPDLRRDVGPRARHRTAARRRVPVQRRRAVSRHRARRHRRRHAFIGAEDHLQQRREPRRVRLFYGVVMKGFFDTSHATTTRILSTYVCACRIFCWTRPCPHFYFLSSWTEARGRMCPMGRRYNRRPKYSLVFPHLSSPFVAATSSSSQRTSKPTSSRCISDRWT